MSKNKTASASEALLAQHMRAHDLLARLTAIVDGFDPESSDWGHVGSLGYVADKLAEIADSFPAPRCGECGQSIEAYVRQHCPDDCAIAECGACGAHIEAAKA